MNYVISLITIYLFFNFLIIIPTYYIKESNYGKSLPLVFISSVLVLYLSQIIFKSFLIGFYLLLILALFGLYLLIRNIKNKEFIDRYLTNGFYLFIIIFLVLALYNYKREFNVYDEFSHWGPFIKSMYRNNIFYCFDTMHFYHKEYPPFFSLFELLWCYLSNSFNEAIITLSAHVFEVSIVFIYYIDSYKKGFKKTLILMVISALIMVTLDYEENAIISIYVDYPMMLYYVYLFLLTLKVKDNKYNFILLVLSLSMFILAKQISIALYLVILFLFICLYFNKSKQFIIKLSSLIIFPLLTYESWNLIIKDIEINKQFDLSISDVLSLSNGLSEIQKSTSNNYISALFTKGLTNGLLKIPYIVFFILVVILIIFLIKDNKRNKLSILSSIIVSFIGYALLMYIMYLFCFSQEEMIRLASYDRYVGFFVSGSLIIVLLTISISQKQIIMSILLICSTMGLKNITTKVPYFLIKTPYSYIYRNCANIIMDNLSTNDEILIINQSSSSYGENAIKYCLWDDYSYGFESDLIDNYYDYDYIYFINYNDLNGLYKVIDSDYIKVN